MNKIHSGRRRGLLVMVLVLLLLDIVTFPIAFNISLASPAAPDHTLTYEVESLEWDRNTVVRRDGSAEMKLFSPEYQNVQAINSDKVVAPGTDGQCIIRLNNTVIGKLQYTVLVYSIKSDENLPVEVSLITPDSSRELRSYTLPKGVNKEDVITARTGTVKGRSIADFTVAWEWMFEQEDVEAGDIIDTGFGNELEPDTITVGFYITVSDDNIYGEPKIISPTVPKTGRDGKQTLWAVTMGVSVLLAVMLLCGDNQKKRRRTNESEEKSQIQSVSEVDTDSPGITDGRY